MIKHISIILPRPLEEVDFRVSRTSDWIRLVAPCGVPVYESPTGDIWEYADGEYVGHQLFTYDAAIRELRTWGKRLPTADEWDDIIRFVNPEMQFDRGRQPDHWVRRGLGLLPLGARNEMFGTFGNCGVYGNYWSSTYDGVYVRTVLFSHTEITAANHLVHPKKALPVRCVRDGHDS